MPEPWSRRESYDRGYARGWGGLDPGPVPDRADRLAYRAGWADGAWDRSTGRPRGESHDPPR